MDNRKPYATPGIVASHRPCEQMVQAIRSLPRPIFLEMVSDFPGPGFYWIKIKGTMPPGSGRYCSFGMKWGRHD